MDVEEEILVLALLYISRRKKRRKNKRFWVRSIFSRRQGQSEYHTLLQEVRLSDPEAHFQYLRMSRSRFEELLSMVSPHLRRRSYHCTARPAITPAERLAITIRFLATGNSQASMSFNFRVGRSTICEIVKETSEAIWSVLQPLYVKHPTTDEEWIGISNQFEKCWHFPHCVGAIDGKHIIVQAPAGGGSTFFNYKGTHSIVLMAICDAHYRFIFLDIGDNGRHSDGSVFSNSTFGQALDAGSLNLPQSTPLPGTKCPNMPYVFVADEAFPLKPNLMRPYPGKDLDELKAVYNYRLSRSRRIIENSFGILSARWRIFRRPIISHPNNVVSYTKACVALHNYLRTTESGVYCPPGFIDSEDGTGNVVRGGWRSEGNRTLEDFGPVGGNRYSRTAAGIRESFKDYFSSPAGEVEWQYNYIRRTS